MNAQAFLRMYHIKCAHIGIAPRVENERAFLQMITKSCTDEVFRLRECGIESEATKVLVKLMATKHCTLTVLDLSRNSIGDEGGKELAYLLQHNNSLTQLDLEGASIGHVGQKALFQSLVHDNTTLTSLNLGTQGTNGRNITKNHILRKLDLSDNHLRDQGIFTLANAIQGGGLAELLLARNDFTDHGGAALAAALTTSKPPVYHLDLAGNR
eukprot:240805-Rhodomonas_salina.1